MASLTLLQIVKAEAKRLALPVPIAAFSSTDPTWQQAVEIMQDLLEEIRDETDWSILITPKQSTITLLNYTPITLPADYNQMVEGSKIFRTQIVSPLVGPITPAQWQQLVVYGVGFIPGAYRFFGGKLNIYGLSPGEVINWEYLSDYTILDTDGTTTKKYWTADTDTVRLPEELVKLGFQWKWKRAKGFSYDEEKSDYMNKLEKMVADDRGLLDLHLTGTMGRDDLNDGTWPGMVIV